MKLVSLVMMVLGVDRVTSHYGEEETLKAITRINKLSLMLLLKPRTCLHIVEMDISQGYPLAKLTPIT